MARPDRLTDVVAGLAGRVTTPPGPVVVGLSGGADSAAMLWLLVERGVECRAIHVIHGLPASPMMATAAGQVAARLGVRLDMVVVTPDSTAEDALRNARHTALRDALGPGESVALAHTADDQAETVLMRILRGTGVEGLRAMGERRDHIVRPLLRVGRAETRAIASLAQLPFRDDPANDDPARLRNRVRAEVLPLLEEVAGAGVPARLASLADLARIQSDHLGSQVTPVTAEERGGVVRVPLGSLLALGDVVTAAVVRGMIRRLSPPQPPERAVVGRVLDVVHGRIGATEVGGSMRATVSGPFLTIGADAGATRVADATRLEPGGSIDHGPVRITSRWASGPLVQPSSLRNLVVPDAHLGEITVRPWSDGDRVEGRLVKSALADAGVPASLRPAWPIVVIEGEPVWVPAVRRRVWPVGTAGRYLCLAVVEEPPWETFAL